MTPCTWLRSCQNAATHRLRRPGHAGSDTEEVCTEHLSDARTLGYEPEAERCDLSVDELRAVLAALRPHDTIGVELPPHLAAAIHRQRGPA